MGQQQRRVLTKTAQRESFSLGTTTTQSTDTAQRESFSLGTTTTQSIDTDSTKGEFLTWDYNNTEYRHRQHKGRVSHLGQQQHSVLTQHKRRVSHLGQQHRVSTQHKGRVSHLGQQHRVSTQHKGRVSHLGLQQHRVSTQTAQRESFSLGTTTTQSIYTDSTKGEFLTWDYNNTEYRHRQHKGRVSHLGLQQHRVSTQTAQRESFSLGTTTTQCTDTAQRESFSLGTTTTQSIYTDSTKGEFLTWDYNNTEYRHRQHKGSFSLGTTTTQSIYTDSTNGEFLTWDNNNTEYLHRQHKGRVSHLGLQQHRVSTQTAQKRVSHLGHIAGSQLFPVKQQGVSDRTKWVEVYQHNFILKHGQQQIMIPYISIFLGKSICHHFFHDIFYSVML